MTDKIDVERAVRASLQRHAADAPDPKVIAARILARTDHISPPRSNPGRRRVAAMPVIAAASVVLVVVGLALLVGLRPGTQHPPAASLSSHAATTHAPSPTPSTSHHTRASSPSATRVAPNPLGLTDFRIVDLSFVGESHGWALGTARCIQGGGMCTAMARTSDGETWRSMTGPAADVAASCADVCVSHVRFATDQTGYVFGPSALFVTTDGGAHWIRQAGGASALETLDGNVIRVTSTGSGCPGPCQFQVETAPLGGSVWTSSALPAVPTGMLGVTLARVGSHAYLLFTGHLNGGAESPPTAFYVSSDDGRTWSEPAQPCGRNLTAEVLTTAPDGTVLIGCVDRATRHVSIASSTDNGATFTVRPIDLYADQLSVIGAASRDTVFVMADVLYRVTGTQASKVQQNSIGPLGASWIGFESATTGHVLESAASPDTRGSALYTTADGGATWTRHVFR